MTKFEKFSEVVMGGFIYPLILALVFDITVISLYFFAGVELMWLVYATFALCILAGIWGVVFLVVLTINKIAEFREERRWKRQQLNTEVELEQ